MLAEKAGEKFVVGETNRKVQILLSERETNRKVQILYKFYKSRSRHGERR